MTRGRKPLVALAEAAVIAARRGRVETVPGRRGDAFDLVLWEPERTVFVKVKRTVTASSCVADILNQYHREVGRLRRLPLTRITAREFWVRSPKGAWQFFDVGTDTVSEIRADDEPFRTRPGMPPGS